MSGEQPIGWPQCPAWCRRNHALETPPHARLHKGSVPWERPPLGAMGNTRAFAMELVQLDALGADGAVAAGTPYVQVHPGITGDVRADKGGVLQLRADDAAALAWVLHCTDDWHEIRSMCSALREAARLVTPAPAVTEGIDQ